MKREILVPVLVVLTAFAAPAPAAKPPTPMSSDRSTGILIDPASAEQVWEETMPPRAMRLYPKRRFRFVSEVAGGFNESKACVVTARAMILPLQGQKIVYAPVRSATTFDAAPNLSQVECKALARGKLKEAIEAIVASIIAT